MSGASSAIFLYELSVLLDLAFTFTIFGNMINMLSFVSTAWAIPNIERYISQWSGLGLWKACVHDGKWNIVDCKSIFEVTTPPWFKAVQAMITLSFIGQKVALIMLGLYGCMRRLQHYPVVILAYTITCFGSALLSSVGLIIFGAKVEEALSDENGKISWSFGLEVVAVILITIAGVFGALEVMAVGTSYRHSGNLQRNLKTGPTDISTISQGSENKSAQNESSSVPEVKAGNDISSVTAQARALSAYDHPEINDTVKTSGGKMVTIDLQMSDVPSKNQSSA